MKMKLPIRISDVEPLLTNFSKNIGNTFPPEGFYVTIRNDVLLQTAKKISLQIANEANTYKNMPDYNGKTNSVTYKFYEFSFDIVLENPTFSSSGAPNLNIGWELFDFVFIFKYHICSNSWPNPCEGGFIEIYTTNMDISLFTSLDLSFSGPTISLSASAVNLNFKQGDIEVYVECTDLICIIPTSDISNAVAQSFDSTFTTGVKTAINNAVAALNKYQTSYNIPEFKLNLHFNGNFALFPSTNPSLILYLDGYFSPDGQSNEQPPFTPTISPPDSVFSSPSNQLNFIFTEYMIRTAIWALDSDGYFNQTITNSMLPKNSPIHLSTDDTAMQQAVPGVKAYPGCLINVDISLVNTSSVTITGTPGIILGNTILAKFILTNSTFQKFGWSLIVDINVQATLSTVFNATEGEIQLNTALSNWQIGVDLDDSNVGSVNTGFF